MLKPEKQIPRYARNDNFIVMYTHYNYTYMFI